MTSAASASWGTHFGLTKLVASMLCSPVAERRSISSILCAVATIACSFWSPSRAPTSTMRTASGRAISIPQLQQDGVGLDELAGDGDHRRDLAVARRLERQFHLHRLDDQQF